ncbi:hypothetical protein MHBO_000342 [Bonamia ostreae]|uniref:Uncharacterized protein n=1 Tax=Bonamia ostreae TaxID=126728 RepID=A0ABV2AFB3_9EUKA
MFGLASSAALEPDRKCESAFCTNGIRPNFGRLSRCCKARRFRGTEFSWRDFRICARLCCCFASSRTALSDLPLNTNLLLLGKELG